MRADVVVSQHVAVAHRPERSRDARVRLHRLCWLCQICGTSSGCRDFADQSETEQQFARSALVDRSSHRALRSPDLWTVPLGAVLKWSTVGTAVEIKSVGRLRTACISATTVLIVNHGTNSNCGDFGLNRKTNVRDDGRLRWVFRVPANRETG
jgi:hypothetical protein